MRKWKCRDFGSGAASAGSGRRQAAIRQARRRCDERPSHLPRCLIVALTCPRVADAWHSSIKPSRSTGAVLELGAYGGRIRLRALFHQLKGAATGRQERRAWRATLSLREVRRGPCRVTRTTAGVASWILARRQHAPRRECPRGRWRRVPGTTASSMCGTAQRRIQCINKRRGRSAPCHLLQSPASRGGRDEGRGGFTPAPRHAP